MLGALGAVGATAAMIKISEKEKQTEKENTRKGEGVVTGKEIVNTLGNYALQMRFGLGGSKTFYLVHLKMGDIEGEFSVTEEEYNSIQNGDHFLCEYERIPKGKSLGFGDYTKEDRIQIKSAKKLVK